MRIIWLLYTWARDTDFGFLNGLKPKNIIPFKKLQGQKVIIVMYLW